MPFSASRRRLRRAFAYPLFALAAAGAHAGTPANDDIANAAVISTLPFTASVATIADATGNPADPNLLCKIGSVGPGSQTVWYRYTTGVATSYVNIDARNSDYDTVLGVFTGSPSALRLAAGGCNDDARAAPFGSAVFGMRLEPTTTYYIVVARNAQSSGAATLNLSVTAAPTYTVTRNDDPVPDACTAGDCSLREAISAANATPGAVLLPAGTFTLSRAGANENGNATGDLDVFAGMGIHGTIGAAGPTTLIRQTFASADRALHIDPGTTGRMTVAVSGVSIEAFGGATFASDGGAVLVDGSGPTFYATFASFDRVVLRDSRSSVNGGAMRLRARTLLRDTLVRANTAASGGGVYLAGDTLTLLTVENSTFDANRQLGNGGTGGAIFASSPLWLYNSTLSGNTAEGSGGGIANFALASGLGLRRETMKSMHEAPSPSSVTAALQDGIAIFSSTIAANTADVDNNGSGKGGGIYFAVNGTSALRNSIIGDNLVPSDAANADCHTIATSTVSSAYNTVEKPGNCGYFIGTGDITGFDAGLAAALAANGGLTPTHLLEAGSSAIDSADPTGCKDVTSTLFTSDQRESPYVRESGAGCDRGAIELQPQPAIPPSTPDLRDADDSGLSTSDNITFITQPAFIGTCSTGDLVEILIDTIAITPSVTCTAGIYTITPDTPITEGPHEVRARATLGPSSALSGILPITIDATAPLTTITSGPSGIVSTTDATFAFSASETATFECRLDTGAFVACTSPRTYTGLQLGSHVFQVRGSDLAGNVEVPAVTRGWTIRLAQTISFGPINDRVIGDPPFTITATSDAGLVVEFVSLTPTVCEVTTPSPGTVTLLDVGECSIRAEQPGDTFFAPAERTRSFFVRPPAPGAPDLDAATDTGVSPSDDITRAATLTFSGACAGDDEIELLVDGAAVGTPVECASDAWEISFAVPEGQRQIASRATRGTTVSVASTVLVVTVDRTAPAAPVITGPTASNSLTVTIVGTGENFATVTVASSTPLCTSAPVTANAWQCDATFPANGANTIAATQADRAGNISVPSANFVVDVGSQLFANGFE